MKIVNKKIEENWLEETSENGLMVIYIEYNITH